MIKESAGQRPASLSPDILLKYALDNGIIDLPNIEEQIEMNKRKEYLEKHDHAIWQSKDGKWCTYLTCPDKPKNRVLCKRGSRSEVEDEIINYWKTKEENPTIREIFDEWNNRRLARKQIKAITYDINRDTFKRFYGTFGDRKIMHVSKTEWEDFLCDCIVTHGLTAKCFSNLKGITKGFLKRAKKRGLIDLDVETFFLELDVSDADFKQRVIADEKEIFYDDEIAKIMHYIGRNPDLKNLGIALMFVTGIRVGELVALKHEDFDGTMFKVKREQTRHRREDGRGHIYEISDFPKTPASYRTVIVPTTYKWITDKLRLQNPFSEFIFLDQKGDVMTTDMIRKRLYLVCKKVGIPQKSPHKIRKTYGSILLDNGVDRKLIEGQMGHTDITCTERFYHRNRRRDEQKQWIIDAIPEFSGQVVNN